MRRRLARIRRRPISLAIAVVGTFVAAGLLTSSNRGGRTGADLLLLVGYGLFLAWFGTGIALAARLPAFRLYLASALLPVVGLVIFGLGWLISPEGMFRAWSLVGGLLLLILGISAVIGFVTASIGWCHGFRGDCLRRSR
ncbi:hypothetical protein AB1L88_00500 [Tautonia sp. JC769]|uniref:hypothetical protein n=1 Tax=Tautonia sp. JC769 TaxID=3232135 RepID=UPI003458DC1F